LFIFYIGRVSFYMRRGGGCFGVGGGVGVLAKWVDYRVFCYGFPCFPRCAVIPCLSLGGLLQRCVVLLIVCRLMQYGCGVCVVWFGVTYF
jgi:hypothetical protein